MHTIQGIDSWSQFVKIVQEAKARTHAAGPAKNIASGTVKVAAHARANTPVGTPLPVVHNAPGPAVRHTAQPNTKVLGSFFDACA